MDEVEMNTGFPKKQQRITYQSTQRTTRQALKYYNTQENNTIDIITRAERWNRGDRPNRAPHIGHRRNCHTTTLRPPSERQSHDVPQKQESTSPNQQTWTPQSSNSNTIWKDWQSKIAKRSSMTLAKQNHDRIAATLSATLSTMKQENNTRFAREEAKIEENTNALESIRTRIDARIDALENSKSSSSSGSRKGNEQNSVRAVATGFTESSTEEEVREILQVVIN